MGEHYTVWVKADCPFCVSAKDELYNRRASHTINIMDERLEELNELKELWNHSTVPIIVYRDGTVEVLVGGCSDLKEWFDGRKND